MSRLSQENAFCDTVAQGLLLHDPLNAAKFHLIFMVGGLRSHETISEAVDSTGIVLIWRKFLSKVVFSSGCKARLVG